MRTQPREYTEPSLFKCGTRTTTVVSSSGDLAFNFFCERWDCEACRKFKIKKIQGRVDSFKGIFVYTGVRPAGKPHFIERHIKGDYVCIRFDSGKFMICEQKFPGCTRREKRTFIGELPTLMQPITEGRRISKRRTPTTKTKSGEDFLGRVAGDHVEELAEMKPVEKVRWMLQQSDRVIFPGGWRLLKEESQSGGQAPPNPPARTYCGCGDGKQGERKESTG